MTKKQTGKKDKLIKELNESPLITRACSKVGIARSTYYNWVNEDVVFRHEVKDAQAKGYAKLNDFVESKLLENINDHNQAAISYYLRFNHARYRPHTLKLVIEERDRTRFEAEGLQRLLGEMIRLKGVDALIDAAVADPEEFKKKLSEGIDESYKRMDEI